jgi:hypothetical protein
MPSKPTCHILVGMASEGELWRLLGETIREHPELDEPRLDFAARLDDDEKADR